ncbi:MAG: hypothetical protein P8Y70_07275 [Candidatus Lokiarchaeota archaeon]
MDNLEKIRALGQSYKKELLDLQTEVEKSSQSLHLKGILWSAKINIPQNVKEQKKEKIKKKVKKVLKEIKKKQGLNPVLYLNDIKKSEKVNLEYKNLYEIVYRFNIMGFINAFALFESFNNELFYLLEDIPINERYRNNSIHNIEALKNKIKNVLKIEIDKEFGFWDALKHYHQARHILVHRMATLDKNFVDKVYNDDLNRIGSYVVINNEIFKSLINLLYVYICFLLVKINEIYLLNLKNK